MSEDMNEWGEILQDFLVESTEIIESLPNDILALEKGEGTSALLDKIFRGFHTLKGASGFLGLVQCAKFTHKLEDLLNKLRKQEIGVSAEIIDLLLEATDLLNTMISHLKENNNEEVDTSKCVARIETYLSSPEINPAPINVQKDKAKDLPFLESENKTEADQNHESVLIKETGHPSESNHKMDHGNPGNSDHADIITSGKKDSAEDHTVRVSVSRLDHLMNFVGELVLNRNRIQNVFQTLQNHEIPEELSASLLETIHQLEYNTSELQNGIMKTRMFPVSKLFSKFNRLARELERQTEKQFDLLIEGEETELDKTIIEEINDPLIHIVRNAVDHGLETNADRVNIGKPFKGQIRLKAYHQGDQIVIEISDDGRGMDSDRIIQKALNQGMISASEVEKLSKREIYDFIFKPGFSTKEQVSDLSGRGVGMDVVKSKITNLKGIIEIDSEKNKGSVIKLKLPLTLAIIQVLVVKAGVQEYCIPLTSVVETRRIKLEDIIHFDHGNVIEYRDSFIPIIALKEIYPDNTLPMNPDAEWISEKQSGGYIPVVVLGLSEKRKAVIVDSLERQEEIVIKSMTRLLEKIKGYAGCTLMGDGKVSLILDVDYILGP